MSIEKEYNDIVECVRWHKPLIDFHSALYEYAMKTLEEKPEDVFNGEYQLSHGS
ncbi:MAG: hypothetical protein IJW05_11105 [Lentisphaeria bacterium]|nr:hypothetical protein [Lentisphaeria bacterium]